MKFQSAVSSLVLDAAMDEEGRFVGARLLPVKLVNGGFPVPDASGESVALVAELSRADFPDTAEKAADEATDRGVQIFAVGIGADYEADHLLRLVTPSNGTVFGDSDAEAIRMTFSSLECS